MMSNKIEVLPLFFGIDCASQRWMAPLNSWLRCFPLIRNGLDGCAWELLLSDSSFSCYGFLICMNSWQDLDDTDRSSYMPSLLLYFPFCSMTSHSHSDNHFGLCWILCVHSALVVEAPCWYYLPPICAGPINLRDRGIWCDEEVSVKRRGKGKVKMSKSATWCFLELFMARRKRIMIWPSVLCCVLNLKVR